MLYASGMKHEDMSKPQIGISAVWWEGNPVSRPPPNLVQDLNLTLDFPYSATTISTILRGRSRKAASSKDSSDCSTRRWEYPVRWSPTSQVEQRLTVDPSRRHHSGKPRHELQSSQS